MSNMMRCQECGFDIPVRWFFNSDCCRDCHEEKDK